MEFVTKVTNDICVKYFQVWVKFSRKNAKNYPICEICRIQARIFKITGMSLYLRRQLHKNWQFVQNRWVKLPPSILICWPKMSRFSRVKLKNLVILVAVKRPDKFHVCSSCIILAYVTWYKLRISTDLHRQIWRRDQGWVLRWKARFWETLWQGSRQGADCRHESCALVDIRVRTGRLSDGVRKSAKIAWLTSSWNRINNTAALNLHPSFTATLTKAN